MFIYSKVKNWLQHKSIKSDIQAVRDEQRESLARFENSIFKKLSEIERIALIHHDSFAQKCEELNLEILIVKEQIRQAYLKFGVSPQEFIKPEFRRPREFNHTKRQYKES